MKHQVSFDEKKGIVRVDVIGETHASEVTECFDIIDDITAGYSEYYALIDLRKSDASFGKEERKVLQKKLDDKRLAKLAVIETNPIIRMMAKVMTSVRRNSKPTNFFRTEEEALAWLKAESMVPEREA